MIRRYTGQGALVYGATLVLVGLVMIVLGGTSAAGLTFIPTQLAYAVSGGLVGLVVVGVGLGLVNSHVSRIAGAEEAHQLDRLAVELDALLTSGREPLDGWPADRPGARR